MEYYFQGISAAPGLLDLVSTDEWRKLKPNTDLEFYSQKFLSNSLGSLTQNSAINGVSTD